MTDIEVKKTDDSRSDILRTCHSFFALCRATFSAQIDKYYYFMRAPIKRVLNVSILFKQSQSINSKARLCAFSDRARNLKCNASINNSQKDAFFHNANCDGVFVNCQPNAQHQNIHLKSTSWCGYHPKIETETNYYLHGLCIVFNANRDLLYPASSLAPHYKATLNQLLPAHWFKRS